MRKKIYYSIQAINIIGFDSIILHIYRLDKNHRSRAIELLTSDSIPQETHIHELPIATDDDDDDDTTRDAK